jgi:hypothetical protein
MWSSDDIRLAETIETNGLTFLTPCSTIRWPDWLVVYAP